MPETVAEHVLRLAQDCVSLAPVIVLGSGASAAHSVPTMSELRDHLLKTTPAVALSVGEEAQWVAFVEALRTTDLESALSAAPLPDLLNRHVVQSTWDFLVPYDVDVFHSVIRDRRFLPLTHLYQHLFTSTHNSIDVVTPNYDRLAEYAADAADVRHFTGFGTGYLRTRAPVFEQRLIYGVTIARTVNIWKVHGSLDWFHDTHDLVIGLSSFETLGNSLRPAIVTPGIEKYRQTHTEPFRSILQAADNALHKARAYLCVGYGFNDEHIQPKMVERCQTASIPLVLITHSVTAAARNFFLSGQCPDFLAIEKSSVGARVFTAEYADGVDLPGSGAWQLGDFLSMVT